MPKVKKQKLNLSYEDAIARYAKALAEAGAVFQQPAWALSDQRPNKTWVLANAGGELARVDVYGEVTL